MKHFVLITISQLLAGAAWTQPGVPDSTFNADGIVTIDFGRAADEAWAAGLQPDGRIVLAGTTTHTHENAMLIRCNSDGTLDSTFDHDGFVTTPFWASSSFRDVLIQPDGKILVSGYTGFYAQVQYNSGLLLARYDSNGKLDKTFGSMGSLTTSIKENNEGRGLALQTDGKIVVAGISSGSGMASFYVARYNPDGLLDQSFDTSGVVITWFGNNVEWANAAAVQSDGMIVIAGFTLPPFSSGFAAVARYNTDGSLDSSFGLDGKLIAGPHEARDVKIQADGKIVIAARGIIRLNPNGSIDSTFGSSGRAPYGIVPGDNIPESIAMQPDGKLLVAGRSSNALGEYFSAIRYNHDGTTDSTFATNGKLLIEVANGGSAYDIVLLPDSSFVAAGSAQNGSDRDFAAVKFLANGDIDSTFGTDGIVMTPLVSNDRINAVLIQPNWRVVGAGQSGFDIGLARLDRYGEMDDAFGLGSGKLRMTLQGHSQAHSVTWMPDGDILTAGEASTATGTAFGLSRITTSGKLDFPFGDDGSVVTYFGTKAVAYASAIQPDDRIVAAGYSFNGSDNDFALARYMKNGLLDNSFGIGGKVTTPIGAGEAVARAVLIQPDKKIVAAGYARGGFAVARYLPNGSLDNTFDNDGRVITPVAGSDTSFAAVLQVDGRLVVAGTADDKIALVRYTTTGGLDNAFGSGGKVLTSVGVKSCAYGVALQQDGKIIVAGYSNNGNDDDFVVVRYHFDGSLDTTFSATGFVVTPIGQYDDVARAVAIAPDGKIVAGGYSNNGYDDDFAIVRYISGLDLGVVEFIETHDPIASRDLLVYPNPIRDHAMLEYTLTGDEHISIHLFDLQGRIVTTFVESQFQQAGQQQQSISLADELPSGMYVIVLSSPKGSVSVRIVKQ